MIKLNFENVYPKICARIKFKRFLIRIFTVMHFSYFTKKKKCSELINSVSYSLTTAHKSAMNSKNFIMRL